MFNLSVYVTCFQLRCFNFFLIVSKNKIKSSKGHKIQTATFSHYYYYLLLASFVGTIFVDLFLVLSLEVKN